MAKNASSTFNNILSNLTPKQKDVIVNRYGLNSEEPITLSALGERFSVTRERIRQIESAALKTIAANLKENMELLDVLRQSQEILKKYNGVARKETFLKEHQSVSDLSDRQINVLIEALPHFYFYESDDDYNDFYYLSDAHLKALFSAIKKSEDYFNKNKDKILALKKEAIKKLTSLLKVEENILDHYLHISKKFHLNPYGDFGLKSWSEIQPRTIREKIYLVLKKKNEPLHFKTIADLINEASFDQKEGLTPTVHNELIKDSRFVLVGRGMYALREQGYEAGTTRAVIEKILKKNGPLKPAQVVKLAQERRLFKPNTILINLRNKKYFKRLKDGRYALKK